MLQQLKNIICQYVEIEPDAISEDSNLRTDIGATSFDLMNIAVAIEEEYGISVPDSLLPKIKTVGDVMKLLENK